MRREVEIRPDRNELLSVAASPFRVITNRSHSVQCSLLAFFSSQQPPIPCQSPQPTHLPPLSLSMSPIATQSSSSGRSAAPPAPATRSFAARPPQEGARRQRIFVVGLGSERYLCSREREYFEADQRLLSISVVGIGESEE